MRESTTSLQTELEVQQFPRNLTDNEAPENYNKDARQNWIDDVDLETMAKKHDRI